ncbi:ATP-binding cassette domain-containing protein, partial [Rubripirellula amarantea]|nr:ATP-binding cassette domain-containing protein [Rubripirellula amarantea]
MSDNQPTATNPSNGNLIEVDDVSVGFDGQWVLRDINLHIPRGQTLAIIGESGCGKTVFMKTLVGLVTPSSGTVQFDHQDLAKMNGSELAKFRRRIGFVFQNAALFDSMS